VILAWVGSKCGIPSPCPNDDGEWNGHELGDEEPCVLCTAEDCIARVVDWQSEGNAIAEALLARGEAQQSQSGEPNDTGALASSPLGALKVTYHLEHIGMREYLEIWIDGEHVGQLAVRSDRQHALFDLITYALAGNGAQESA
jgi:hypothetical protein